LSLAHERANVIVIKPLRLRDETHMTAIGFEGDVLRQGNAAAPSVPATLGVFDSRRLAYAIALLTATVLLLGYSREIYVAQFGLDTALKNLRHFDLDDEGTLPAWYSSVILLFCSALLGAIALLTRNAGDEDWKRWALLCAMFVFIAADEASAIHETAIMPLRNAFALTGVLHFSWVIVAVPAVVVAGLFFLPFLFRLPLWHSLRFMLAGAIFIGGALCMELVSGHYASSYGLQSRSYILTAMVEETMELVGSTLFLVCLLAYVRERFGGVSLAIR
jgi:hypothetical protein